MGSSKHPFGALGFYKPETFPLLARVTHNGTAGPAIKSYLEIVEKARSPAEPPLVDPITGFKNSPNAYLTIACSDSGARVEELGMSELEAVFNKYLGVSQYFASLSSQLEIICLGK